MSPIKNSHESETKQNIKRLKCVVKNTHTQIHGN